MFTLFHQLMRGKIITIIPDDFWFYPDCSGLNYQSYSGTCNNVDKNSGLLIIIPDDLNKPLTKISIKLKEQISKE